MLKRIISRLDVKNGVLVKGINLEGLRNLGDPNYFAEKYYEDLIDEIHFQDIVASLYNRNALTKIVEKNPTLKIVFEHITTTEAAQFVMGSSDLVAATITPQHLLLNRNDLLVGGVKPHN